MLMLLVTESWMGFPKWVLVFTSSEWSPEEPVSWGPLSPTRTVQQTIPRREDARNARSTQLGRKAVFCFVPCGQRGLPLGWQTKLFLLSRHFNVDEATIAKIMTQRHYLHIRQIAKTYMEVGYLK